MLDIHVLLSPDTRADWQRQCLTSVHEAIKNAGYPVAIREIAGRQGHIGKARAEGYAMGAQPYVTYVDCDDYLLPEAFSSLTDPLTRLSDDQIDARFAALMAKLQPKAPEDDT